jgi:uncharacterized protein (DUF362 family)
MSSSTDQPGTGRKPGRRYFLKGAAGVLTLGVAGDLFWEFQEAFKRAETFVAAASSYGADLERIIQEGLRELGIGREQVRGKSVLLKPNLVEPNAVAPQINTHPAVVRSAADVFRSLDAKDVLVAEGQGHCRDTYWVLEQSGLGPVLDEAKLTFVDLNHDDIVAVPNVLRKTSLKQLFLPRTLAAADLVVSMPKMKTHHLQVVTLSMKNMFGVMPGICYGWPKNVLHNVGIEPSILDIVATVKPQLAIVDGIVGMEGDGPIMGTAKTSGVLVMGRNLTAVDATAARLMSIGPLKVPHLARASGLLGPIGESHIEQRGEKLAPLVKEYLPAPSI